MTIYKRVIRCKTVGSRNEGNLRPDLTLPQGVNSYTIDYDEEKGECTTVVWSSDTDKLRPKYRGTAALLEAIVRLPSVIEELKNHPDLTKKTVKISGVKKLVKWRKDEEEVVYDEG